jgi:hypothetical protein
MEFESDDLTGGSETFSSDADSFASEDTSDQGSTSSDSMASMLAQSPFGRLKEVLGEDGMSSIFSGLGNDSGSNPFGGGSASMSGDSPYGGNPFAGDNFWNIFAGGVNPSNI